MGPALSRHWYLSTACLHELHTRCPDECKFCNQPCNCECHDNLDHDLNPDYGLSETADTSRDHQEIT